MATMIRTMFLFLLLIAAVAGDDVQCLKDFKSSVSDPDGHLSSWNFSNTTVGSLCYFYGVTCWNFQENRVISLSLSSSSLSGPVPSALLYCSSITTLDLSSNSLSGPIPPSLCTWLPYLVSLNLSGNSLSGPIPPELSDCKFLNKLHISSNMLSGSIPPSLSGLARLRDLDLSNNDLSGIIPAGLSRFDVSSFQGNPSLLSDSKKHDSLSTVIIVNLEAGVLGFLLALAVSYLVWRSCFFSSKSMKKYKKNKKRTRVSSTADQKKDACSGFDGVHLFQEPIEKLMVSDLLAATADFHSDHAVVAGSPSLGTSYKAVLQDGSTLTVKKLRECWLSKQRFWAEVRKLGQIRHPNLVPLLGFCLMKDERLLIYKNMANGALSSRLQSGGESLDWPMRLRIGIGAARGLAWLHHGFKVPFLHHNLSSSAVLLSEDYDPRITDFGLARLLLESAESGENKGPLSTKGDVYEFGLLLLELATDKTAPETNNDLVREEFNRNLVDWTLWLSAAGRTSDAIGRALRGKGDDDQIVEFLKVACKCVAASPEMRPSMYQVYESMKSIGGRQEISEHYDEFPLLYNKD